MAKIEGIRIKNFRSLKDITLGKLWNLQGVQSLTPMTVVIGKNGVGKSTLFDVFGFLADALKLGVEEACDLRGRGGFDKIRSQGQTGPIEFEIYYKEDGNARPIPMNCRLSWIVPDVRLCKKKGFVNGVKIKNMVGHFHFFF